MTSTIKHLSLKHLHAIPSPFIFILSASDFAIWHMDIISYVQQCTTHCVVTDKSRYFTVSRWSLVIFLISQ